MGQIVGNGEASIEVSRSVIKPSLSIASWLWIVSMAALGAWVATMAADRQLPTEYIGKPIVVPDPVEDGGRVIVKLPVKRNRSCPGVVQRTLLDARTDEVVAFYDPVPSAYPHPMGAEQQLPKTFELPPGLPARVRYTSEVCFSCNILQNWFPICTTVPSVTFNVIQPLRK